MTSIIITLLIVFCKVPFIQIMGDRGMGYYSTALVIYLLLMTCIAYGIPKAASSILISQTSNGQYHLAYKTVQSILLYSFITGAFASVITFVGARFIAEHFMSAELSLYAIRSLSPCIFLISVNGALHGIYKGTKAGRISRFAYIIEKITGAVLCILGALCFRTYASAESADAYCAMGGALGFTCGILISCIFMTVFFFSHYKKLRKYTLNDTRKTTETCWQITKKILQSMIPVMLTLFIFHISRMTDYAIFNRIMKVQGHKESEYIELLGMLNGKYEFFITIPVVLVYLYVIRKTQILSQVFNNHNVRKTNKIIGTVFRYTMIYIIPCTAIYVLYSSAFMNLFFNGNIKIPSFMLKAGAVSIIFYSLTIVSNMALNVMENRYIVAKNAVISAIIQIISLMIMMIIFEWEIIAVVFSRVIFSASFYIFNEHSLREFTGYVQEKKRTFSIPFTGTAIMSTVSYAVYLIADIFMEDRFALLIAIPFALITYIMAMVFLGGITQREMYALPGGKYLAPLCKKLHLIT